MATPEKTTTTVSTKGQVILPHAIRRKRHWDPGTKLIVEDTPEGVLLKAAPLFPPTKIEDVFGCLKYEGPAKDAWRDLVAHGSGWERRARASLAQAPAAQRSLVAQFEAVIA
jgi:AbrB family looped-hinge helix DNA binding protein